MGEVMIDEVPKEVLGACLPIRLEGCSSEDLEAVLMGNTTAHAHMARIEDRRGQTDVRHDRIPA
jgi:hypothetical protein